MLEARIAEHGFFDGGNGMVYADFEHFENNESLLCVYFDSGMINAGVYSVRDGGECLDTLSFVYGGANEYMLSTARTGGGEGCIIFTSNGKDEVFIMKDDSFTKIYDAAVYGRNEIAGYTSTGIICKKNPADIYKTLNALKEQKINASAFTNIADVMDTAKKDKIKATLSACADCVEFDQSNPDKKRLLKNILYTYSNYSHLTDISPDYTQNAFETGYEGVHSLNGEYIDFILQNIYKVEPEHPNVNNLLTEGVCYTNGDYFFTGGYSESFKTVVKDLRAVYDLGNKRYYVIFTDEYTENCLNIPEYSYGIIDTRDEIYSLVRLSMNASLLEDREIAAYSETAKNSSIFENDGDDYLFMAKRQKVASFLTVTSILAISAAVIIIIIGFVSKKLK